MALVLKKADEQKGILVFTHKEIDGSIRSDAVLIERLKELKARYLIGVHIGACLPEFIEFEPLDFYLAPNSFKIVKAPANWAALRFKPVLSAIQPIPLSARSFIPHEFGTEEAVQRYDMIMIARAVAHKNPDKFMLAMKDVYRRGKKYRALLVSLDQRDERTLDLSRLYHSTFTDEEKELFTLLLMSPSMGLFPLPASTISFLLRSSKAYALFSLEEGDSRGVHEALMADRPVVVSRRMKGGARDFLDECNSVQFGDFSSAPEAIIRAVESSSSFSGIRSRIEKYCSEKYSISALEDHMEKLFKTKNFSYTRGRLATKNLSLTLAAHSRGPTSSGRWTSDLTTRVEVLSWINNL